MAADAPFGQLDFLYMPSRDVAADLSYFTEVLGARRVFAIDAMVEEHFVGRRDF